MQTMNTASTKFETSYNTYDLTGALLQGLESFNVRDSLTDEKPDALLFGGVGMHALLDPRTQILWDEKQIIPPPDIFQDSVRRDSSGNPTTVRDMDLFVVGADTAIIDNTERAAAEILGSRMRVDAFGLNVLGDAWKGGDSRKLAKFMAHIKAFTCDRMIDVDGDIGPAGAMYKGIYPIFSRLAEGTLEPWSLVLPNERGIIHVPSPHEIILNYLTRSVGGLRPKDAEKVHELAMRLYPDGNYSALRESGGGHLYNLAASLGKLAHIGDKNQRDEDPVTHEIMKGWHVVTSEDTVRDLMVSGWNRTDLKILRRKAQVVHWGESHQKIVDAFLRPSIQDAVASLTKNRHSEKGTPSHSIQVATLGHFK
jgi:hypothetical protein